MKQELITYRETFASADSYNQFPLASDGVKEHLKKGWTIKHFSQFSVVEDIDDFKSLTIYVTVLWEK